MRGAGGVPDAQLVGDVEGAATYLKAMAASNGRVATIGYCSGGRQSSLAACRLTLNTAVDCYGAFVVAGPPADLHLKVGPVAHLLEHLSCPLLGLFGAEDHHPPPEEIARSSVSSPAPEALRVPHLRRRRAHLLLHRPAQLPPRGRPRGLGHDLGLLRSLPVGLRMLRAGPPRLSWVRAQHVFALDARPQRASSSRGEPTRWPCPMSRPCR